MAPSYPVILLVVLVAPYSPADRRLTKTVRSAVPKAVGDSRERVRTHPRASSVVRERLGIAKPKKSMGVTIAAVRLLLKREASRLPSVVTENE
eukprot:1115711-Rhodomonas_salina.1